MNKKIGHIYLCIVIFCLFTKIPFVSSDSLSIPPLPTEYDEHLDMVIISPSEYEPELQPLIDHKNSIGVQTILKTTDEIYQIGVGRDEAEQIKHCIKDLKEDFNISFVLLVGGAEDIPGRYTHIYFDEPFDYPTPDEWVFTSDYYYADLYDENGSFSSWDSNDNDVFAEYHWYGNTDKFDLTPDISIGRLACVNGDQVVNCVQKIISYEQESYWSQQWFSTLVLIAGDGIPFDEESIDESEYLQEQIIQKMSGFIPNRVWASNGKLLNVDNINQAIEQGAGFVFFNGHGLHHLWATYLHDSSILVPPGCYRTNHINQLSNFNKLPIVISDACYHVQYDQYPDCFGWSFVSNPEGGAIAFIGGSDTDLAYAGTRIVEKGIERLCLKWCDIYQNRVYHLGDLWSEGLIAYQPEQGDLVDILTVLQNHLIGDPSLRIHDFSQPPIKPDPPRGPVRGKINVEHEFTAVTCDPENESVYYLFDWDDGTFSEWIGPLDSGVQCSVHHTWGKKGDFQLRVKAMDENGVMSEWSDPISLSVPKAKSVPNHFFSEMFSILDVQWNLFFKNKDAIGG